MTTVANIPPDEDPGTCKWCPAPLEWAFKFNGGDAGWFRMQTCDCENPETAQFLERLRARKATERGKTHAAEHQSAEPTPEVDPHEEIYTILAWCECNIWEVVPLMGLNRCGFCRTRPEVMPMQFPTREEAIETFVEHRGRYPLFMDLKKKAK